MSPASDSGRKVSFSGFGIDTVAVRGPVSPGFVHEFARRRVDSVADLHTGEIRDVVTSGGVDALVGMTRVRVHADSRTGRPEVRIEFSAPSIRNGHNADPLEPSALTAVLEEVLIGVGRDIQGLPSVDQLRPIRLDLTRDFRGVDSPRDLLEQISLLPVRRGGPDVIVRPPGGGVQTLTRGVNVRWQIRGYDKYHQLLDLARKEQWRAQLLRDAAVDRVGQLRVELQLRDKFLREARYDAIADLWPERLYAVAEQYFVRARFGDSIGSRSTLATALTSLTKAENRNVCALLLAELLRLEPAMSGAIQRQTRAQMGRHGISVTALSSVSRPNVRLDFCLGRQVPGLNVHV